MSSDYSDWLSDAKAAWLLDPEPSARIREINSYPDLDQLLKEYGVLDPLLTQIDFERLAADGWDAIHLTDEGQWATRLSMPHSLYGWDCESTLWLRWCFANVERLDLALLGI